MKLTTRSLRNISFATMLAVLPLAQQVPVFAEGCGPYWLQSLCSGSGGYLYWRGCDSGSCVEPIGGSNCYDYCISCNGQPYDCLLPD
jgi:hypothetical protein